MVTLEPCEGADTYVNGKKVTEPSILRSGGAKGRARGEWEVGKEGPVPSPRHVDPFMLPGLWGLPGGAAHTEPFPFPLLFQDWAQAGRGGLGLGSPSWCLGLAATGAQEQGGQRK